MAILSDSFTRQKIEPYIRPLAEVHQVELEVLIEFVTWLGGGVGNEEGRAMLIDDLHEADHLTPEHVRQFRDNRELLSEILNLARVTEFHNRERPVGRLLEREIEDQIDFAQTVIDLTMEGYNRKYGMKKEL